MPAYRSIFLRVQNRRDLEPCHKNKNGTPYATSATSPRKQTTSYISNYRFSVCPSFHIVYQTFLIGRSWHSAYFFLSILCNLKRRLFQSFLEFMKFVFSWRRKEKKQGPLPFCLQAASLSSSGLQLLPKYTAEGVAKCWTCNSQGNRLWVPSSMQITWSLPYLLSLNI